MPFEIKPADPPEFVEDPRVSVLPDDDWAGVLALARRHGFDPEGEYEGLLYPESGESGTLGIAASQALAVALSEALREETAARENGEEGETDISVGPADEPELRVDWAKARGIGEIAESGTLTVTRLP